MRVATINEKKRNHHCSEYHVATKAFQNCYIDVSFSELALQRGKQSVDLLFDLRKFITKFSEKDHVPAEQLWKQCCVPLISSLSRQSTNASREVRHTALIHLQRILLGQQVLLPGVEGVSETVFDVIVFPLLDSLLQPQIVRRDPRGIPETRLRASVLLCKVFMQLEVNDGAKEKDILPLWIEILDILDRLMNADRRDQLVRRPFLDFGILFITLSSTHLNQISIPVRSYTRGVEERNSRYAGNGPPRPSSPRRRQEIRTTKTALGRNARTHRSVLTRIPG